jgi:hypothetical protein
MGVKLITVPALQADTQWKGKTILWLGTSIPTYGYPELAGAALGATIVNNALGSSMVRKAHTDGNYTGFAHPAVLRALSHTIAEKQAIIDNWATIRTTLAASPAPPTDLTAIESGTDTYAQKALSASYENRLVPYLNGTYTAPDLIVLDHGYNDFVYNGIGRGTPLDSQADFIQVPSTRNNRNYFIGAVNYIIDVIYSYKPKMKIVIGGHYESQAWPDVVTAQQAIANYWSIPYFNLATKLGWSQQTTGGVKMINKWLTTDNLHPSETDSKTLIANNYIQFLKTIYP